MATTNGREISPDEIKRGKAFSQWITAGLAKKRWKIVDLHETSGVSRGYLGLFVNKDGILPNGAYQRPGEEIIHKIAVALEIDESEGRQAAGYSAETSPDDLPAVQHYTIGEIAGSPVELSIRQTADEEQLQRLQLAVQIIFHKPK